MFQMILEYQVKLELLFLSVFFPNNFTIVSLMKTAKYSLMTDEKAFDK